MTVNLRAWLGKRIGPRHKLDVPPAGPAAPAEPFSFPSRRTAEEQAERDNAEERDHA